MDPESTDPVPFTPELQAALYAFMIMEFPAPEKILSRYGYDHEAKVTLALRQAYEKASGQDFASKSIAKDCKL